MGAYDSFIVCDHCKSLMIICGHSAVVCPNGCMSRNPNYNTMTNLRRLFSHLVSETPLDKADWAHSREVNATKVDHGKSKCGIPKKRQVKSLPGQKSMFENPLE
jgi:hypothetical protein